MEKRERKENFLQKTNKFRKTIYLYTDTENEILKV